MAQEMLDTASKVSREATALVREYIEIQNSVFKFSIMKALGLKRSDPAAASEKASGVLEKLTALLDEVRALKLDAADPLGSYCITLRAYLRTLCEAVEGFIALCGKMQTAREEKNSKYWKYDYKGDLDAYQLKETDYMKIGLDLNEKWAKLRNAQK